MFVVRFNKLGLDKITAGEEPNSSSQVEEVNSYTPVQSAPLNSEKIVYIDIGTAHSVAVTGKERKSIYYFVKPHFWTSFFSNPSLCEIGEAHSIV